MPVSDQGRVIPVSIEDEIKESYLNYAMSVIVSRALPDVRDGLKPVHRRILFSMSEMGLRSDRPTKKAARIVGDVLGKYHPHGDLSVYDALVRMAQEFSLRYPLVNGQGNFGSVEGDPPAAMRYTEARMSALAEEMLADIKKETVDFGPNYDDSMEEPLVLPAALPFLLVNGASGIAVGMATNMAPHNLREVANAIAATIDDPEISMDDLMKHITGPDFPTGGIIFGRQGIREAFRTGRGRITVRSRFVIETTKSGRDVIIVTEIPYQVNLSTLMVRIAELVHDHRIDGISDLRNESDRNGMRVVIELKKGASPKIVLNQLFANTQLQVNFNVNALALVHGRPRVLTVREIIHYYIEHRKEVVTRRSRYDLRKAEERAHILEGLKIALDNIDEVIQLIRQSENVEVARTGLMTRFGLSEIQSQAILDMRLQKLTSLETQKIIDELNEVLELIRKLKELLSSEEKILNVVKEEVLALSEKYGDARRTEIVLNEVEEINIEDLIEKEDMVVLISHRGYIKRVPYSAYRIQGRGGKGSLSAKLKEDDFVQQIFIGSTHDYILFITSAGKAYWLKVHEIPEAARNARGQHIKSVLAISANEEIAAVVSLTEFSENSYVFMATSRGVVKKVRTSDFSNAKTRGIIAVNLDEGDRIVTALLTTGDSHLMLVTRKGQGLRMAESSVRSMGRASRGVQGIRLGSQDELAGVVMVREGEQMLIVSEFGYGKRTDFDFFSPHGRGTRGQIASSVNEKTGEIVGIQAVKDDDELIVITSQGNTIRLRVNGLRPLGRQAAGVKVVDINQPDFVVGIDRADNADEDESLDEGVPDGEGGVDETVGDEAEGSAPTLAEESDQQVDENPSDTDE
ncbi:MAG TPA: DNA topoisomerase (ATP-hydrolyzing) subunit A [Spirochaetia bacterium]|nr:DNA topoisomerase (ATP-hydrolyzing) subunit A [Spirochaetia bacterium]